MSINLLALPTSLASTLGIDAFSAGLLASLGVALFGVLLVLVLSKGKAISSAMIIGVCALGFCTAISWFPAWFFVILILLTASGLALKFKDML